MTFPQFFRSYFFFPHFAVGSQHSGTADENHSATNDLDNSKSDLNNSIDRDQEDSEDEERTDTKCVVCEHQCDDIDQ